MFGLVNCSFLNFEPGRGIATTLESFWGAYFGTNLRPRAWMSQASRRTNPIDPGRDAHPPNTRPGLYRLNGHSHRDLHKNGPEIFVPPQRRRSNQFRAFIPNSRVPEVGNASLCRTHHRRNPIAVGASPGLLEQPCPKHHVRSFTESRSEPVRRPSPQQKLNQPNSRTSTLTLYQPKMASSPKS